MSEIWKGTDFASKLPSYDMTPGVGIKTSYRHETTYAKARALAGNYYNAGIMATCKQIGDSPVWSVEATLEGENATDLQSTHELRINLLQNDVKANRVLQGQLGGIGTSLAVSRIAEVESIARSIISGKETYENEITNMFASELFPTPEIAGIGQDLLDMLLAGTTGFQSFAYVYVHTFNFGSWRDTVADFVNVQKIFTTAQLIAAENIPTNAQVPNGEWLKLPPEQVVQLGQRKQLKYEYWWAEEWSRLLYEEAVIP